MPPIPKPKKPVAKKVAQSTERPVLYERPSIKLHDGFRDPLFTAEEAKLLLGWTEETPGEKFGSQYLFIDEYGKKIRCLNNPKNRPFRMSNAKRVKQEILRKRWKLNLESMIIGNTGVCLSCQHRLVGLVLAVQEWEQHKDEWPEWTEEPNIACLIAFGCDESDDTVNTMDTGEPRTLADVIYRTGYFAKYSDAQREQVSKVLDYAVRCMWERTGAVWDAHSPYRTHAESLAFIERHPRIVECVNHIYVENGGNKKRIAEYFPTGYAAGFLYLMACSEDSPTDYQTSANESDLEMKRWDDAVAFWVNFAARAKSLAPLFKALGNLSVEGGGGSRQEKSAIIIKAWRCIIGGLPLTAKALALDYETDSDGIRTLNEIPTFDGIDNPAKPELESDEETDA